MSYLNYWNMLGYSNNALMMMEAFDTPSSIILTDNPEFTKEDFNSIFPVFVIGSDEGNIPEPVYNLFYVMADKAIKYDRYKSHWKYLMCLFIAHHCVLFLQTQQGDPGAQSVLQHSLPSGVATSKSVGSLSVSYDLQGVSEDLSGYGTWKYTIYGQQLATLTKMYGHSGMWING